MKKKPIILLIGVIIIVLGVYISLNYQPDFEEENMNREPAGDSSLAENQFKDVQLVFYNSDGTISWYLRSNIINSYSEKKFLDLSPVDIDAVDSMAGKIDVGDSYSTEQIFYHLTATDSFYDMETGRIQLAGPVEIDKDQIIFETTKLNWQDGKDQLLATGGVKVESPDFLLIGERLESDLALNNIVVTGNDDKQAFFTWQKGSDSD